VRSGVELVGVVAAVADFMVGLVDLPGTRWAGRVEDLRMRGQRVMRVGLGCRVTGLLVGAVTGLVAGLLECRFGVRGLVVGGHRFMSVDVGMGIGMGGGVRMGW
jgi:hypothetical protein